LGETYVELTPARRAPGRSPRTAACGRRGVADCRARRDLPGLRSSGARPSASGCSSSLSSRGRGRGISDSLGNLAPFAEDTNVLLKILNAQHTDVQGVVRDTGEVFDA
jgi:hypothetical protein